MNDFFIQLAAGLIATLVGVWLGRSGGSEPVVDNARGVIGGNLRVDQSRHWHFLPNLQLTPTRAAPSSSATSAASRDGDDGVSDMFGIVGVGAVVLFVLALGYLLVREPALLVFRVVSTFLVVFSLVLLGTVLLRRRAARGLLIVILVTGATAAVTIRNQVWLSDADLYSDRIAEVIGSELRLVPTTLLNYLTWDEVAFLGVQGFGLLLTALVLLVTTAMCLHVVGKVLREPTQDPVLVPWGTGSRAALGAVWVLILVASMLCSSGWASEPSSPIDFADGHSGSGVSVEVSAKLSPSSSDANLLCARVSMAGDRKDPGLVTLERRVRGKRGARAWEVVGSSESLSANGTACREVFMEHSGSYRFSIEVESKNVRSEPTSLVGRAGNAE